jgi:hypothetical protein
MTEVRGDFDNIAIAGKNSHPARSEIKYDGGAGGTTALSLTTPTVATALAGMNVGSQFIDVGNATLCRITCNRPGDRRVQFTVSEIGAVISQVITIEVFKNNVATGIRSKFTQPATAVAIPQMNMEGTISVNRGDTLDLKVIASTGNFTWVRANFSEVEH